MENRLTVKFSHDHPNKSDRELQTDVETVLGCTLNAGSGAVKVTVQDGIVTLKGNINSYWEKDRIRDLAASVDGVLQIQNDIRVSPREKPPDSAIKKEIVSALERMEVDGLDKVDVDVKDEVVALSGHVPTWSTSFDIEDTARYTGSVIDVKNNLAVD